MNIVREVTNDINEGCADKELGSAPNSDTKVVLFLINCVDLDVM